MKQEQQIRKWLDQFGIEGQLPTDGRWVIFSYDGKLWTGPSNGHSYFASTEHIIGPASMSGNPDRWAELPMKMPDPPPKAKGPRVFPVASAMVRRVHAMMGEKVEETPWAKQLIEGLAQRYTFGLQKYGQTLHRDDGREDDIEDELFDWFVYMVRHLMRRKDPRRYTNFLRYLADMLDFMWADEHFPSEMVNLEREHG